MGKISDADLKRLLIGGQVAIVIALLVAHRVEPQRVAQHLSPEAIARRVALIYGEKHPRLASVISTLTEADYATMYVIVIDGRFQEDHLVARHLAFSALADRFFVWGREAYDDPHQIIFVDDANLGHL